MLLFGFMDNQRKFMFEFDLAALHRWILVAEQPRVPFGPDRPAHNH
jgi:hypothetical protein